MVKHYSLSFGSRFYDDSHEELRLRQPLATTRIPVFARNAVSTSHPLAAQAGLRMLWKGGSAVDAAIAAAAAMTICEPVSNGLGSDAFAILWDGKQLQGINGSGTAPAGWTPEYFRKKYGGDAKAPPKRGIDSATVPGAVATWVALSERYGKLPFGDLLAPAIEIAERGYLLPDRGAAEVGRRHAGTGQPAGLRAELPALGPCARVGELFQFRRGARAAPSRDQGQGLLRRRDRRGAARSRPNGGGTVQDFAASAGMGQAHRRLPRLHLHEIPPNGQGIAR
jgi:gamma-glutamyltranspeptidase/glutathione hydrolase